MSESGRQQSGASDTQQPLSSLELLTTTRAVRRRLDLDRPVAREIIRECVDIAVQAPNAVNAQRLDWIVVDDPDVRAKVAEIFRFGQNDWVLSVDDPDAAGELEVRRQDQKMTVSPEKLARAMATMPAAMSTSVRHLREHLHEVPVLVVPVLAGRPEGANVIGQAAFWGSLFPTVWNFMLALRTKGLGSAWTSVHLSREREMAELLGIPYDEFTQAGLFPVAYTIGTTFKKAPRPASRIHWNGWESVG